MSFGPTLPSITRRGDRVGFSPHPPSVLVADDHEDSRVIARLVLESSGFRVLEAKNGREALTIACAERPRAMLLDIVMPELTGWDVTRELRSHVATAGMVIIVVTALAAAQDRERSIAAGCDDLLTKPVHPRALLEALRRHTGHPPGVKRV